ncbi:Protein TIC 20-II, chloroplastic [Ancistrocladus abbreviatus]
MASNPLLRLSLRPSSPTTATYINRRQPPSLLFHPLKNPSFKNTPQGFKSHSSKTPKRQAISMSYKNNPSTTTPAIDRLISATSYLLPFFNGLQYGRFLFTQYPSLSLLFEPILPIFSLYKSLPYASFVAFFAIYLVVVRNPNFSHYVRFNAMQALVLDILLVVPLLLQRILSPGRGGIGFKLMVMGHNALFVFVVLCFVYSLVFSVLGKTPYLPFVADAAGRQL